MPLGSVLATSRFPPSSLPLLSAGNSPVDQITQLAWLGRREITFRQVSSMVTTALPFRSWPVTTRLILRVIRLPSTHACGVQGFKNAAAVMYYQTRPKNNRLAASIMGR